VTSDRNSNKNAARERKRLERERKRLPDAIVHETPDWRLFLDPETLPQKAGCEPDKNAALVLKELVDNALDEDAKATIRYEPNTRYWIISDNGPGLDPDRVPELFAVNRPLRSSKLKRLPKRGMLGNGLRVVMAWARQLIVQTRGVRLSLIVDESTGHTTVVDRHGIPDAPGLVVVVRADGPDDGALAKRTIGLSEHGFVYVGPSSPWWYGPGDFSRLFSDAPASATAADVIRDLDLMPSRNLAGRLAGTVVGAEASELLREMRQSIRPITPDKIGRFGPNVFNECPGYARKTGVHIERSGGHVPYSIEAHVGCQRPEKRSESGITLCLTINRSESLAAIYGWFSHDMFHLEGCGIELTMKGECQDFCV
jgi:hypothetical protein